MSALTVPLPLEVPGEDVLHPPFAPVRAGEHLAVDRPRPLPQVAWPDARPEWDDLSTEEQLVELRRGELSEFYEVFVEDPTVWADCDVHGPVVVMAEGVCPQCGLLTFEARGLDG